MALLDKFDFLAECIFPLDVEDHRLCVTTTKVKFFIPSKGNVSVISPTSENFYCDLLSSILLKINSSLIPGMKPASSRLEVQFVTDKVEEEERVSAHSLSSIEWMNRGNALFSNGDIKSAEECYCSALQVHPSHAEAMVCLGVVRAEQGRFAEAENDFRNAIQHDANWWLPQYHLFNLFLKTGRQTEAKIYGKKAAELNPSMFEIFWQLGVLDMYAENWSASLQAFQRAHQLDQQHRELVSNIGSCLMKLSRYEEAYAAFQEALLQKETAETHLFAGIVCDELKREAQAVFHYRSAIRLHPEAHTAHYQLSFLLLARGDFKNGFSHFEHRLYADVNILGLLKGQAFIKVFGNQRYWSGQSLVGKRLLVITEQGLGDSIMMMRYMPFIKERYGASRVIVSCDTPLLELFKSLPGIDTVQADSIAIEREGFDYFCMALSLPAIFDTTAESIPKSPYIRVPLSSRARWDVRMAELSGLKVGLVWAGGKFFDKDAIRSMSLGMFESLFSLKGITWVSLQKGEAAVSLKDKHYPVLDWMDECQDLMDTASLITHLDLVIAVDTSVAHLSGALGCPTLLMNRFDSDWRWQLSGEESPWYTRMRIIRQTERGDWQGVIGRLRDKLSELLSSPAQAPSL